MIHGVLIRDAYGNFVAAANWKIQALPDVDLAEGSMALSFAKDRGKSYC